MSPSRWLLALIGGIFVALGYIVAWWGGFLMAAGMYFSWRLLTYAMSQLILTDGSAHLQRSRGRTTV